MKKITLFIEKTRQYEDAVRQHLERCSDALLMGLIAVFYLIWRLLTLPMFDFAGDSIWKWGILRYYYHTGVWFPVVTDHHQGRWVQNFSVYGMMKLLHSDAGWVAAVIPILTGLGVLMLVYLLSRKIASKTGAVLSCLGVLTFSVFVTESAQFLPSMPATFYTLLALYILEEYVDHPKRLILPLLAGLAMGFSWGCKVTACYWCVGMALFLMLYPVGNADLWRGKRFRIGWDVILFSIGFFIVFIPETLILNHLFQVSRGRFSLLSSHVTAHSSTIIAAKPNLAVNFLQYLFSPLMIFFDLSGKTIYELPKVLIFLLTVPAAAVWLRDKQLPLHGKLITISLTTAFLFHCYFVIKVFPFDRPERILVRYIMTLIVVSLIILPAGLPVFLEKFKVYQKFLYPTVVILIVVLIAVTLAGFLNDPLINGDHIGNKINFYRCMTLHRQENLPILIRYQKKKIFTSRTRKLITQWKTIFGEIQELPEFEHKELITVKWGGLPPVFDSEGWPHFHLWGPRPQPGTVCKCIVVHDEHAKVKKLKITDGPVSVPTVQVKK